MPHKLKMIGSLELFKYNKVAANNMLAVLAFLYSVGMIKKSSEMYISLTYLNRSLPIPYPPIAYSLYIHIPSDTSPVPGEFTQK